MAVFDDGTGPALYFGGYLRRCLDPLCNGADAAFIARWDGHTMTQAGGRFNNGVSALAVYDDGAGPALYVAGGFTTIGSVTANYVAKLVGSGAAATWVPVGAGLSNTSTGFPECMVVHDDGLGDCLYVAGGFGAAGGVPAAGIARWNGQSWSAVGSGVTGNCENIRTLASFDDGSGGALYAGGSFNSAGGVPVKSVARWRAGAWESLGQPGDGLAGVATDCAVVHSLRVATIGGTTSLYAAGYITYAVNSGTQVSMSGVVRWTGTQWAPVGTGTNALTRSLTQFGGSLWAGGNFTLAGGHPLRWIARWDGLDWRRVGSGLNGEVREAAFFDDGRSPALYIAGRFTSAGEVEASGVARWDGHSWSPVGGGVPLTTFSVQPQALASHDDGTGPALYLIGNPFTNVGGVPVQNAARWNGSQWAAAGNLAKGARRLAVFPRASGDELYAYGAIDPTTSNDEAFAIARFDGASWTGIGRIRYNNQSGTQALSAVSFDEGKGPHLYVGGAFDTIDGIRYNGIARWDGAAWSDVGGGVTYQGFPGYPRAMAVYDDGSGPALFVTGQYMDHAGGVAVTRLAKWDGESWSAAGSGLPNEPDWYIFHLAAGNAGRGPVLYAAATYDLLVGSYTVEAVSWDGQAWKRLGDFSIVGNPAINFMHVGDPGDGPAMFTGGAMGNVNGVNSTGLAKWTDCPPCAADCDANQSLNAADFFCFFGLFSVGDPRANCDQSTGTPTLTANDFMCFLNAFAAGCP